MKRRTPFPLTYPIMSRSITNVKLPENDVRWFYETFPEGKLSIVLSTLLQLFREEAEREDGSLQDVLTRIHVQLQT
jgi:uncharacterized protein (DUF3820 family)